MEINDTDLEKYASKTELVKDYLTKGYSLWTLQNPGHRTFADFANWLEVSPQQMTQYLKGTRLPSPKTASKIAAHLGQKIFEILDIVPPDEDLKYVVQNWSVLSSDQKDEIRNMIKKALDKDEYVIYQDGKRIVYSIQKIEFD